MQVPRSTAPAYQADGSQNHQDITESRCEMENQIVKSETLDWHRGSLCTSNSINPTATPSEQGRPCQFPPPTAALSAVEENEVILPCSVPAISTRVAESRRDLAKTLLSLHSPPTHLLPQHQQPLRHHQSMEARTCTGDTLPFSHHVSSPFDGVPQGAFSDSRHRSVSYRHPYAPAFMTSTCYPSTDVPYNPLPAFTLSHALSRYGLMDDGLRTPVTLSNALGQQSLMPTAAQLAPVHRGVACYRPSANPFVYVPGMTVALLPPQSIRAESQQQQQQSHMAINGVHSYPHWPVDASADYCMERLCRSHPALPPMRCDEMESPCISGRSRSTDDAVSQSIVSQEAMRRSQNHDALTQGPADSSPMQFLGEAALQILQQENEADHHGDETSTTKSVLWQTDATTKNNRNLSVTKERRKCAHNNECPFCGKRYARAFTLRNHMRTHTGEKPYHCRVCQRAFNQLGTMEIHMRTHTGERPYNCALCQKRFGHSYALKTHMRTHTGEKPYSCTICNKSFADGSTLYKHKRTHNGEKPFTCKFCQRKFSQSGNMHRHMAKTHNASST